MALLSTSFSFPDPESFPCLLVVKGPEETILRPQHLPITIGRKPEKDICIADTRMSRDHAVIVGEDGQFFIEDQNSKLGTYVNGVRVSRRQSLSPSDRIDFGHAELGYIIFRPSAETIKPPSSADEPGARELLSQITEQQSTGAAADLERLSLFLEAARKLNTACVLDEILVTLIEATLRLTKAERGFVFLCDKSGKLRLAAGLDERGRTLREDSTISHSTLAKAVTSACEFLITDTASSELAQQMSIMNFDLRTVICIPLLRHPDGSAPQVSGALYLDSQRISRDLSTVSNDLLRAIAREAAALVENAELVQEQENTRRYEQELAIAGTIQQQLMTVKIPGSSFAQVHARNIPCKEIGGDFFDVIATESSISAVLADICGKGVSAALLASILQGMIYAQLKASVPLAEIADVANRFLCQKDLAEKYATLTIARLSPDGLLEFINCGHVTPFLVRGGTLARTQPQNPPVGLLEDVSYTTETYELAPGDRLVVFTDGITEAQNAAGSSSGTTASTRRLQPIPSMRSLRACKPSVAARR